MLKSQPEDKVQEYFGHNPLPRALMERSHDVMFNSWKEKSKHEKSD